MPLQITVQYCTVALSTMPPITYGNISQNKIIL